MRKILLFVALMLCVPQLSFADFTPVAPGNLAATVNGVVVDLSWDWGNAGQTVSFTDFESEVFPAGGWEVRNTQEEPMGNWISYFFEEGGDQNLAHSGTGVALVLLGAGEDTDPAYHQDEWLMVRPGTGAVYLDFWYYLHPELLEVGGYEAFPDHYYVKISRDNGATWTELWDGRWDMGDEDAVQKASLFLGEPTDENTIVAFNAVSAEDNGLYFVWAIDDVQFTAADGNVTAAPRLSVNKHTAANSIKRALDGKPVFRKFTPMAGTGKVGRPAKTAPGKEGGIIGGGWLNNGLTTYRVYLDGNIVGDYIKALHFKEFSGKSVGRHTYKVMAWSEAEDKEYAASEVTVDIDEFEFNQPKNVVATYYETTTPGKYEIIVTWEDPDGNLMPAYYDVYVNNRSIGRVEYGEEYSLGQTGMYKGVYTFGVQAVYTKPEGESEMLYAVVSPGTVLPPADLTVAVEGGNRVLNWKTPVNADPAPEKYNVYRGDKLLAENLTTLTFTDENVPAGWYLYSVHAVYPDGTVSLPSTAEAYGAILESTPLAVVENFDNGHLPENWTVEMVDLYDRVKDMYNWRFDNWFGEEIPAGAALSGNFASISGVAAGMNRLQCYVNTPQLLVGDNARVTFTKYFVEQKAGPSGPAQFVLQKSVDGGINWTDLADLTAEANGTVACPINEPSGTLVTLRWSFLARNSGFAAFDNVVISDEASGVNLANADAASVVDVYGIGGNKVVSKVGASALCSLPTGIYIVRSGNKTMKYVVR